VDSASAHVTSVDRAELLVPPARSWSELIRRAVHWRVGESCLRFLFDKSADECKPEHLHDVQVTALSLGLSSACRVMFDRGLMGFSSDGKRDPSRPLCAAASSSESCLIDCGTLHDYGGDGSVSAPVQAGMLYAAALHGQVDTIPRRLTLPDDSSLAEQFSMSPYITDAFVLHRALACACLSGRMDVVERLIHFGAGRQLYLSVSHFAFDPLTCAVLGSSLKVAAKMLRLSRALPRLDVRWMSAAPTAAARTGRCKMIALLLDHGADVNAVDWRSPVRYILNC